jgi:hypothetical protein
LEDPPPHPPIKATIVRNEEANRQLRDCKKKTEAMNGSSPDQVTWFPLIAGEKSGFTVDPAGEVRDYLRLKAMMQKVKTG